MNFEDYENRPFSKKYELKDLTPANINKLLKDKLFEKEEPYNYETKIKNSTYFDTCMHINRIDYRISNIVLKEIYNTLRYLIEELNNLEYWEINVIEANIDARYTNDEKIEYLKEKRKELYLSIQNEPEYYVYIGKRDFNGFSNWEDWMFEVIMINEDTVIKYLTNDLQAPDIPKEIYTDWLKYFKMTQVINLCEKKINELSPETIKDSTKIDDFENTIKSSNSNIDLSFQLALLEQIMKLENWDDISANKKGMILTHLIGKNKDNIKNYYIELVKIVTDISSKFYDNSGKYSKDKLNASILLNKILG